MKNFSKYIDYTLLTSTASMEEIKKLCEDAIKYNFFSVCINPYYIGYAKELLENTNVKVCTVIGFPLGQNTTKSKVNETKNAIKEGTDEIDMVINISRLKQDFANKEESIYCINEIDKIKKACKGKVLKVIIETCYLSKEEIEYACQTILKTNADFVKTSTGFGTSGASLENIKIIKSVVGDKKMIKAAGGVKSYEDGLKYIDAGANRIGTSRLLVKGLKDNKSGY